MLPSATIQIVRQCSFGLSLSQPNIHKPKNVDSRKNAVRASSASGAPKISPINLEYSDQFMPKWNSCTIPVTTPMAKLIRNSPPKNFASFRSLSLMA